MPSVFIFQWSIGMQNMLLECYYLFVRGFCCTECQHLIFAGCDGFTRRARLQPLPEEVQTDCSVLWHSLQLQVNSQSLSGEADIDCAGSVTTRPRVTQWRGGLWRRWSVWSVISGRMLVLTARPLTVWRSSEPHISVLCVNCKIKIGNNNLLILKHRFDDEAKGQFHCEGCGICR